ncbi:hypothetical protein [Roseibium sp. RKSG952]|uniref:hypothetical protein n=1 Tax=Roseibium sp. RKSG952 TaxID=2529384 RepID=UPI0034CE120C
MLTRNDKTIGDAEQHLKTALAAGVHHIGFKDVGLPFERLSDRRLARIEGALNRL